MKAYFRGFMMIMNRMLEKPMWMLLLFSLCVMSLVYVNHSVWDLPVAVVDLDHSSASRMVTRSLDASSKIAVRSYSNTEEAQQDLAARKLFAVVVLPHNMEKRILHGENVTIPAYGDATNRLANGQIEQDVISAYRSMTLSYNSEILMNNGFTPVQIQRILSPINAQSIDLFNPGISFAAITFPGLMVMLLQHTLLIAGTRTSIVLHTLPQGKPPLPVYLGCLSALIPIWLFLSVILFVVWPMLLGYRQTASIPEILLLTFPFILATLGFAKLITECLRSVELIYLTLAMVTTPVFYISGTIWPLQLMPKWVWFITHLLPSTWATNAIASVNQMGLSITEVGGDVVMLLVLGASYATLGWLVGALRDGHLRRFITHMRHRSHKKP
ncbi:ABC transporter permease [Budviciaceae bacterium CWB-B4]|uniref:ABC transporter permease n=1 Tax=Limnobaculum xujianqingii TaxID=2738837 RepID=A0A9D7FVK1_9GAMM|nr:ABC transporter permease [Limnobaculum xujianqingii]MBK5071566.1 ABC transporter permease [Limnobaculum xujianqingii]MBK5174875.1 ABC transporter permease [Limnobaculum xujianqingii]